MKPQRLSTHWLLGLTALFGCSNVLFAADQPTRAQIDFFRLTGVHGRIIHDVIP